MWETIVPAAISAAANFFGQQSANDTNIELAQENREWQQRMSNTAHQREVADLQAAGLNPMLSALKGGASTPTGAVARVESSTKDAVNSGATAAMLSASIEKLRAETSLANAGAEERRTQALANLGETDPSKSTMGLQRDQGYHLGFQNANLSRNADVQAATVRHLDAQVDQLARQGKLTEEEVRYVKQRIGESSARELHTVLQSMHLDLDLRRAQNEAEAEASWWKRNISPYNKDVSAVAGAVGAGAIGSAIGRSFGGSARDVGSRLRIPSGAVLKGESRSSTGKDMMLDHYRDLRDARRRGEPDPGSLDYFRMMRNRRNQ